MLHSSSPCLQTGTPSLWGSDTHNGKFIPLQLVQPKPSLTDMPIDQPKLDNPSVRLFSQLFLQCAKLALEQTIPIICFSTNRKKIVSINKSPCNSRKQQLRTVVVSDSTLNHKEHRVFSGNCFILSLLQIILLSHKILFSRVTYCVLVHRKLSL